MTKIILHLGAHRTASTHVQGVMAKNAALLAAHGIVSPRQAQVNTALTQPVGTRIPSLRAGFKKLAADSGLDGHETVVISDENLLGFLNSIFSHGAFYPDTARRLARLKQMLPHDPEKIVIAIRPYHSFFASAYGRWLKPERMVLPRKALAAVVLGLVRSWGDVLADIAATFPNVELSISEYSPDPRFGPSQLKAILGPLADTLVFNPEYRWNRSMSARQTMLYEQAIQAGDTLQADEVRTWKRFKQAPLQEGFWDPATSEALKTRYAADKAAILKRFPAFVTTEAFAGQDAG